jgi:hypothetical protein
MDVRDDATRGGGDDVRDDAVLEGRLGRALAAVDPAPPAVELAAYELFTWRTIDAELEALLQAPAPAD